MVTSINDHLQNYPIEAAAIFELVKIAADDGKYAAFIEEYQQGDIDTGSTRPTHPQNLQLGMFSGHDFAGFVFQCLPTGSSFATSATSAFLLKLIDAGIIGDGHVLGREETRLYPRFNWNITNLRANVALNTIDNILYGPSYLPIKYAPSIPAIIVKKEGQEHIGTGFLASAYTKGGTKVLVTAKHNVDHGNGIEFQRIEPQSQLTFKLLSSKWVLNQKIDVALMPVECDDSLPVIFPSGKATLLSPVISLGYPAISTASKPFLLAHNGEVNGRIETYHGEDFIIISNIASPGSSGGPILDKRGLCVAMVVNSLERQFIGGNSSVNAAISSEDITRFIHEAFG